MIFLLDRFILLKEHVFDMTRKRARVINFYGGKIIMSDGECNNFNEFDFGEGFEHIRSITIKGKEIKNTTYTYHEKTITVKAIDKISGL